MKKTASPTSLHQLASSLSARLVGDGERVIEEIATLETAQEKSLAFCVSPRFHGRLQATEAGGVILRESDLAYFPGNALVVKDPYVAYAKAAQILYPHGRSEGLAQGIHHTAMLGRECSVSPTARIDAFAVIGEGAVIEDGVHVASGVRIGEGCRVGRNSQLHSGVILYHGVHLGEGCIIHAGVVLGSDGFGYAQENGRNVKIPQVGGVVVGSGVEIGANCCIDRGAIEDTIIEDGVKLDNLVQVGHNVCIGAHTVIAGQTGIAGSASIGKRCRIGGQVGIAGHIHIADDVMISGKSMVTRSLSKPGVYSSGMPVEENREWRRHIALLRRWFKKETQGQAPNGDS